MEEKIKRKIKPKHVIIAVLLAVFLVILLYIIYLFLYEYVFHVFYRSTYDYKFMYEMYYVNDPGLHLYNTSNFAFNDGDRIKAYKVKGISTDQMIIYQNDGLFHIGDWGEYHIYRAKDCEIEPIRDWTIKEVKLTSRNMDADMNFIYHSITIDDEKIIETIHADIIEGEKCNEWELPDEFPLSITMEIYFYETTSIIVKCNISYKGCYKIWLEQGNSFITVKLNPNVIEYIHANLFD